MHSHDAVGAEPHLVRCKPPRDSSRVLWTSRDWLSSGGEGSAKRCPAEPSELQVRRLGILACGHQCLPFSSVKRVYTQSRAWRGLTVAPPSKANVRSIGCKFRLEAQAIKSLVHVRRWGVDPVLLVGSHSFRRAMRATSPGKQTGVPSDLPLPRNN